MMGAVKKTATSPCNQVHFQRHRLHWSSGYDVRLTRGRSPVQSWDAVFFCHRSSLVSSTSEWFISCSRCLIRLAVRTPRCGRGNPGSNPGLDSFTSASPKLRLAAILTVSGSIERKTVWPSGLRRQTQVLVEQSAWVRIPQLTFIAIGIVQKS